MKQLTNDMQYIFTAVVGRSGQFSLAELFNKYGIECFAEAEPPSLLFNFKYSPKFIYKLQRKYLVSDEMLGRGKALQWFEDGDFEDLDRIVKKKIKRINRLRDRKKFNTYIEISKFFLRTQADAFFNNIPSMSLIKLTRDPISNARSFLNRNKNFYLDNNPPESKRNYLCLNSTKLTKFQLYLWSWFEMELRYHHFIENNRIKKIFKLRTEDLNSKEKIKELFQYFKIEFNEPLQLVRLNTNLQKGLPKTIFLKEDLKEYFDFLEMVSPSILEKIDDLNRYEALYLS